MYLFQEKNGKFIVIRYVKSLGMRDFCPHGQKPVSSFVLLTRFIPLLQYCIAKELHFFANVFSSVLEFPPTIQNHIIIHR